MTTPTKCQICRNEFVDTDRVIFSHRDTFVFKPADVPDAPVIRQRKDGTFHEVSAAAVLSPHALAQSRAEHLRTAVVNTFGDWGKMTIPEGAFYFRHQWCEPQRTGSAGSLHPVTKHSIRFGRSAPGRMHG